MSRHPVARQERLWAQSYELTSLELGLAVIIAMEEWRDRSKRARRNLPAGPSLT